VIMPADASSEILIERPINFRRLVDLFPGKGAAFVSVKIERRRKTDRQIVS